MPDFNRESSEVAMRFHRDAEWYVASRVRDVHVFRVHANSERIVELFLRLTTHLDDLVELVIAHERDGVSWRATTQFLPTVREALGRLRWPLASFGGTEVSLITEDDQVTLTPWLELVIYSHQAQWREWLEVEGLFPRDQLPTPLFDPRTVPWSPAPELTQALASVVERLKMERAL
jgi:hypothetical protein